MMEARIFWMFNIFIAMLFVAGFYYIILTRNLVRVLIGIELLMKAVTLLIMLNGYINRQVGLAQAMVVTVIIIEVFFVAVAAGIVLNIFRKSGSMDTRETARLKG
jgi:NADH-quinone oxidoreductase subunit K